MCMCCSWFATDPPTGVVYNIPTPKLVIQKKVCSYACMHVHTHKHITRVACTLHEMHGDI